MATITTTAPARHNWALFLIAVLAAAVVALTITLVVTLSGRDSGASTPAPTAKLGNSVDPCYHALRGPC